MQRKIQNVKSCQSKDKENNSDIWWHLRILGEYHMSLCN